MSGVALVHPAAEARPSTIALACIVPVRSGMSAVMRNRLRRRCRAAFVCALREEGSHLSPPLHLRRGGLRCALLVMPTSSSLTCTFAELLRDARSLLRGLTFR